MKRARLLVQRRTLGYPLQFVQRRTATADAREKLQQCFGEVSFIPDNRRCSNTCTFRVFARLFNTPYHNLCSEGCGHLPTAFLILIFCPAFKAARHIKFTFNHRCKRKDPRSSCRAYMRQARLITSRPRKRFTVRQRFIAHRAASRVVESRTLQKRPNGRFHYALACCTNLVF